MAGMTFAALARHLALMAAQSRTGKAAGLDEAGRMLAEDAKGRIGQYQRAVAPFPAWAPLADSTRADRVRQGYPADDPLLREGDLHDSVYHEVKGHTVHVFSRSPLAPHHEFGTSKMPPRPFLGPAVAARLDQAGHLIARRVFAPIFGGRR